ncbi:unnamed protein product, partial [Rotaria sp. Silwood2]
MNPVTIAYHFFKQVRQRYNFKEENLLTDAENEKVKQLISFFQEIMSSYNLIIETEYTLDLSEDENTSEGEMIIDWKMKVILKSPIIQANINTVMSKCKKIVEQSEKMSFNSLKHHYRKLKNSAEVSHIRKYVAKGGTNFQKYESIKTFVWRKFQLARNRYLPVKDEDLKRWSLQKSKEIKLENFTGSQTWIRQFKINRNISSCTNTKVISSKSEIDNEKIMEEGR